MTDPTQQSSLFVALLGAPNAGKSTLLNQLVGQKISIVTHKVQTTRFRIMGVCMEGAAQLVFVDTPGIFAPKARLDKAMVNAAWSGAKDADVSMLLIDASRGITPSVELILKGLETQKTPCHLILNKIDATPKETLLTLTDTLKDRYDWQHIWMVSALKDYGIDAMKSALAKEAQDGPWLFPDDQLSDINERLMAAEFTREQCLLNFHQEVPYGLYVETEQWKHQPARGKHPESITINQVIVVERDAHKKMILGTGGNMIKRIGAASRREMEKQFGCKTNLFLFVKTRKDWKEKPEAYQLMGLEFGK